MEIAHILHDIRRSVGVDAEYLEHATLVEEIRNEILPDFDISLDYSLKADPGMFLFSMVSMAQEVQDENLSILNIFPLRSSCIPGHIRLDSRCIIELFYESTKAKDILHLTGTQAKITANHMAVWNHFFLINILKFKRSDWKFDRQILTDGFSATVLYCKTISESVF